jgi:protein-S-isoprenylcysteine O-methyltransferase Ste14
MLQLPMADSVAFRGAVLLLSVSCWIATFIWGRFTSRHHAGALLAFLWHFQAALILNILLVDGGVHYDLLIGQAVLTGPVGYLVLGQRHAGWPIALGILVLFVCSPDVFSNGLFFFSQICVVVAPSLLLASWTGQSQHIYFRSLLQAVIWACLLLWLFPFAVFKQLNTGWESLLERSFLMNIFWALPMAIPATLLLGALFQFAKEGNGTGFPYDPPQQLVTHGVYGHISNPMQLGICLMVFWWGVMLESVWISASAFGAGGLFVVFKDICNGSCAVGQGNADWESYQRNVPAWMPRLTPWAAKSGSVS